MRYSLFIDESGDFNKSKEWIVSGILCPYDKETAEKYLKKTLGHLPQRLDIASIRKMHLTELRNERGHGEAVKIADSIFSALNASQYKWKLVVCRNQSKFGLSDPERTYRLMLLDLIALAESTIPEGVKLSGFDIVIATRTDITGRRMTTLVDLDHDVVKRISDAIEAGIASRGMINFIDSKGLDITTIQANKSWGLITADFICNISYNYNYSSESELLNKLKQIGLLFEFRSFGGYQERRACIAERDGNFIDAIRRWAFIEYKNDEKKEQQINILIRLFDRIMNFGTAGPRSTLDAIIEHIWRDETLRGKYSQIYKISERIEVALNRCHNNNPSYQIIPLLYRIQNFMHLISNKTGDIEKAKQLVKKKKKYQSQISLSPEFFPLVLDSQLYEIDTVENELLLSDCLSLAYSHHALVDLYRECWELLAEDSTEQGFNSSRLNIKSEMTLLRSQLLANSSEEQESAIIILSRLKKLPLNPADKNRLLNYEMLAHIKYDNYRKAITLGMAETRYTNDQFIVQHLLRATVSGLLVNREKYCQSGEQLLSYMDQYTMHETGHPVELIWRDWGMLNFLLNRDKKIVLRYLKRSKKHLLQMPQNAPIIRWLDILLDLHLDFVKGTADSKKRLYQLIDQNQIGTLISIKKLPKNFKKLLIFTRCLSPY